MSSCEPLPPAPRAVPETVPDTVPDARGVRWDEFLCGIAGLLPPGAATVLVDGAGPQPGILAGRLAARVPTATIRCCDGPGGRGGQHWDAVIWVRTAPAKRGEEVLDGASRADGEWRADGEGGAGIVVDMHDPDWPVIRRVAPQLAGRGRWYLTETRAFFAARAAGWDTKFGDDLPAYAAAIAQAGIPRGGTVADVGCGTGRALPALRHAVGPDGTVVAIDVTPEMLREARNRRQAADATLVLADARRLPLADACAHAIFAAGLVNHLPDTEAGLRELARVTRTGGLLVLFHPSGRAALAARHGRALSPDEPLAAGPLRCLTRATGWELTEYDDAADRFFALAVRD